MGEPNDLIRGVYTTLLTYVFSFQQEIVLDQSWLYAVRPLYKSSKYLRLYLRFRVHPIYGNNSIIIISLKISSKYKYKYTYAKDRKILSNFLLLQFFLNNIKHDCKIFTLILSSKFTN